MSQAGQNGIPRPSALEPHKHEVFRELCAISTTGELTEAEEKQLGEHLEGCADCRKLKAEYEVVAGTVMPALAAEAYAATEAADPTPIRRAPEDEPPLPVALDQKLNLKPPGRQVLPGNAVLRWAALGSAAAILLAGAGISGYQWGLIAGKGGSGRQVSAAFSHTEEGAKTAGEKHAGPTAGSDSLDPASAETARLRGEVREDAARVVSLEDQIRRLEADRRETADGLEQLRQERADLRARLDSASSAAAELQNRLALARSENGDDAARAVGLASQVKELTAAIEARDREIARDEALLDRDRDIRNLISARNLYIAEIYDVARNGTTQKPFGRVFYTKDKSLIFYGYDLDEQKGTPKDVVFQAWGRKGADEKHDVNLGLLYQDDSRQKRWVLKFDDAKTISQMDAIFVTAEPEGGSAHPTSKPLLFTYLRIDPNHP